jgi:hypothetical protein
VQQQDNKPKPVQNTHVALEKCTVHSQKGQSFLVTCKVCGWGGAQGTPVSLHKLLYGHYLKQPDIDIMHCQPDSEIQAREPEFWAKIQDRLRAFTHKRRLRLPKARIGGCKRQCISQCSGMCQANMMYNPRDCGCKCPNNPNNQMMGGGMLGVQPMAPYHRPYNMEQQKEMVAQANAAWDKFFYMCRLPLELGETPLFKEAIQATLKCGPMQ